MHSNKNKTSIHYVHMLLDHAEQLGFQRTGLMERSGLSEQILTDADTWIDNQFLTRLVKEIWRATQDEAMGFYDIKLRPGSGALVFDYMLDAQNISELYQRGQRITSFLPPDNMGFHFSSDQDHAALNLLPGGNCDPAHFMTEFEMVIWHRFACWAIDQHIPLVQASFAYPKPSHGGFYTELFHCELVFDAPTSGFCFPGAYLKKPLCRSKIELADWLLNAPANLLYLSENDASMRALVKQSLRTYLQGSQSMPGFEAVCSSLSQSPQTVRRRLVSEGSSYQQLKDVVRNDLALELLSNQGLSIATVAHQTGFSEPAAFSRAFKKWQNLSPADYRQALNK